MPPATGTVRSSNIGRPRSRIAKRPRKARRTTSQSDPLTTPGVIQHPNSYWGPLGKSYKTTLRAAFTILLDPTQGGTADHIFSANGIGKPDITDVTSAHQCYSHDQLTKFFDHYTVIGSKCTVTVANQSDEPVYLGAAIRDNNTDIIESNDLLRAQPGLNMTYVAPTHGGDCLKSVTQTYSPNRFFGKSKGNVVGESELRGNMNDIASVVDNPEEGAYYHVLLSAPNPGVNISGQTVQVELEYTVVLTEPKQLAQRE